MNTAVTFECEWTADGALRLRFLNAENQILGQEFVAAKGLTALHLLISIALAKKSAKPESLMEAVKRFGLPIKFADILESSRVRAGMTPEGEVGLDAVEGEDVWAVEDEEDAPDEADTQDDE
jgi:hypothetical protein